MRNVTMDALLCGLASLAGTGCGDDGDDAPGAKTNTRAGTGGATAGDSGSGPGAVPESGVADSPSSTSPQGSCPEGFRCTMVPSGPNQRACIAPGEVFAPSCNVVADCEELPGAVCIDPGLNFGSLCALSCTI